MKWFEKLDNPRYAVGTGVTVSLFTYFVAVLAMDDSARQMIGDAFLMPVYRFYVSFGMFAGSLMILSIWAISSLADKISDRISLKKSKG